MISNDNKQVTFTYSDNVYDYTVMCTYICESESQKNGIWLNNFNLYMKNNNTNKAMNLGCISIPINPKDTNQYPFNYKSISEILYKYISNERYNNQNYVLKPHNQDEINHILSDLNNIMNDNLNTFGCD